MAIDEEVVDVSQDWEFACDVQQRFMHGEGRNAGFAEYSARCRQLRALGGDCFDFMPLAENRLALAIGDASGKGIAAALMIASVQSSLRTAALFTSDDLARLLKIVNLQAYNSSLNDRFATVFYGVFDRTARMLRYVNAGHNSPLVLRQDGAVEWLEPSGAPVGMFADSIYSESILPLNPGDVVITYTDGVVEVTNPGGEEWGVEGLLKAATAWDPQCVQGTEDLVRQIFHAMDDFSGGCQTDDATVAALRVV
jgi:phosphoserine phosphatase RsbU/P